MEAQTTRSEKTMGQEGFQGRGSDRMHVTSKVGCVRDAPWNCWCVADAPYEFFCEEPHLILAGRFVILIAISCSTPSRIRVTFASEPISV